MLYNLEVGSSFRELKNLGLQKTSNEMGVDVCFSIIVGQIIMSRKQSRGHHCALRWRTKVLKLAFSFRLHYIIRYYNGRRFPCGLAVNFGSDVCLLQIQTKYIKIGNLNPYGIHEFSSSSQLHSMHAPNQYKILLYFLCAYYPSFATGSICFSMEVTSQTM